MSGDKPPCDKLRIDKLLWHLRWVKSRSAAQSLVETASLRLNGRRVERAAQMVGVGDIMVLPRGIEVLAIEILTLPKRRGPAQEAQSHYRVLDETRASALAASQSQVASERILQP